MHSHSHELTLGVSFLLGALHAFEPGHGKTAMFVYLLGGRRSFWHPIVIGVSTAVSHSLSLLAIALVVHATRHWMTGGHVDGEQVTAALQGISAGLVVLVGLIMLVQAVQGNSSCCQAGHHGHHPDCRDQHLITQSTEDHRPPSAREHAGPGSALAPPRIQGNFRTTAMLGLAVGLLPCPTALAACFTSLSVGTPVAAYLIIALFGAGIACALSAVGIALQFSGDRLSHWGASARRIPWSYARAMVILAIGLLCFVRLFAETW